MKHKLKSASRFALYFVTPPEVVTTDWSTDVQVDQNTEEHREEEEKRSEKLKHVDGIFALGDCCANIGSPLPALAQVTEPSHSW